MVSLFESQKSKDKSNNALSERLMQPRVFGTTVNQSIMNTTHECVLCSLHVHGDMCGKLFEEQNIIACKDLPDPDKGKAVGAIICNLCFDNRTSQRKEECPLKDTTSKRKSVSDTALKRKKARPNSVKKKRAAYTNVFKLEVLGMLRPPGNSLASVARFYNISESTLRGFRKDEEKIISEVAKGRGKNKAANVQIHDHMERIEDVVKLLYERDQYEEEEDKIPITVSTIVNQGKLAREQLLKAHEASDGELLSEKEFRMISKFKASNTWAKTLAKRHDNFSEKNDGSDDKDAEPTEKIEMTMEELKKTENKILELQLELRLYRGMKLAGEKAEDLFAEVKAVKRRKTRDIALAKSKSERQVTFFGISRGET